MNADKTKPFAEGAHVECASFAFVVMVEERPRRISFICSVFTVPFFMRLPGSGTVFELLLFIQIAYLRSVISKGVSEPRVFISGRVALRDLLSTLPKHKVPRPYSGAEEGAPSLTGARDDDLL